MALHHRTHPDYVDGCYACKLASVHLNQQSLSTRDHVTANMSRTRKILAQRQEVHAARTDLRYGRRGQSYINHANIDGMRPRAD